MFGSLHFPVCAQCHHIPRYRGCGLGILRPSVILQRRHFGVIQEGCHLSLSTFFQDWHNFLKFGSILWKRCMKQTSFKTETETWGLWVTVTWITWNNPSKVNYYFFFYRNNKKLFLAFHINFLAISESKRAIKTKINVLHFHYMIAGAVTSPRVVNSTIFIIMHIFVTMHWSKEDDFNECNVLLLLLENLNLLCKGKFHNSGRGLHAL